MSQPAPALFDKVKDATAEPQKHSRDSQLPSLTIRLRNLHHAEILNRLEIDKNSLTPDMPRLVEGLDLQYAALALLLFLMERRSVDLGAQRSEIIAYMSLVFSAMNPNLREAELSRCAELVLDCLTNRREQSNSFRCRYFDPSSGMRDHDFRLVNVAYVEEDGRVLYSATDDAIVLLLESLNVSPEVAQKAEELMLEYLVSSGRITESIDLAERARLRSLQYQQSIRNRIYDVSRVPESARWVDEVVPELQAADAHIQERQRQERTILEAVYTNKEHATGEALAQLISLEQIVGECQSRHSSLHIEVLTATRKFLDVQVEAFAVRKSLLQYSLQDDVLTPLLSAAVSKVASESDLIASLMSPPKRKKLLNISHVLRDLTSALTETADETQDDDAFEDLIEAPEMFSRDMIASMQATISQLIQEREECDAEEILNAICEGDFSTVEKECAAYLVVQSYIPGDNLFGAQVSKLSGQTLSSTILKGDNLHFVKG